MADDFGDRMKAFERQSERKLSLDMPIIVRIDGKKFSKLTKKMQKPYDHRMHTCMENTTKGLLTELHADFAYTQSDEITLVFIPKKDTKKVSIPFEGRVQKMASVFAAIATSKFVREYDKFLEKMDHGGYAAFVEGTTPYFDCRVFNVPDVGEATNAVLWRIQDAKKNAISCVYRWRVGHKSMQNKSGVEMITDMGLKGIYFHNEYSDYQRTGTIYFKVLKNYDTPYLGPQFAQSTYSRHVIEKISGLQFILLTFNDKCEWFGGEREI